MKGINLSRRPSKVAGAAKSPGRGTTYLDNAATTYPKPDVVYERMDRFFRESGVSPDRGSHRLARLSLERMAEARKLAANLINAPQADRIIFTRGATEALNLVLKGLIRPGDHVLTTTIEHNSVIRPLSALESSRHIEVVRIGPNESGVVTAEAIESRLTPWTRLVVMTHASNVTGVVQPVAEVANLLRDRGVRLILDCAQTAGCWPIDASQPGIDAVVFSGHKGAYGPPGVGVLWLSPTLDPEPLLEGGTGSRSESEAQPLELPGRYESGTINFVGIAGLAAGIEWVLAKGVETIGALHRSLIDLLAREAAKIPGVRLYAAGATARTGVQSLNVAGHDPEDLATALDQSFGIAVRAGLHCAPGAHKSLGTHPKGAVRVSVSSLTGEADILYLVDALRKIVS